MTKDGVKAVGAVVVGDGFIGSAVARAFADSGRPVVVVGRRHAERLADIVRPGVDVVFAAGPSVPADVEADPSASQEALRLLATALDLVRRAGGTLLFVSSGGTVYGEPERLPIDEGHPLRPVSAYGMAMVTAESLVADAVQRHGIVAASLRCANAYGSGQDPARPQGLVAALLDAVVDGRPVEIWGDGSTARDYIHVDDVAAVAEACAGRRDLPPALNVGTGRATSVVDLVGLVESVTGVTLDVRHHPRRPLDVTRVALDTTRLRRLLDFEPLSLEAGLRRTWARTAPRSPV